MSREINIGYRLSADGSLVDIDIRAPYFLFGTQQTSKRFWDLPLWGSIGVTQLAELSHADPVYFIGWESISDLAVEIALFTEHFKQIDFDSDLKSWFLAHLVYCHGLLVSTAPESSIPELTIG